MNFLLEETGCIHIDYCDLMGLVDDQISNSKAG